MSQRTKREHSHETRRIERESKTKDRPTRFYSARQEKIVAESFGGTKTKNSGATMFDKGDVKTDNFLLECKTKTSPSESISIKKEWLENTEKEALFVGKPYSALAFNFGTNEKNYFIISDELFHILIDNLSKVNNYEE